MKSGSYSSWVAATPHEARPGGERDDESKSPATLIVAEADPDEKQVLFRVVCPTRGMSPTYRLKRDSADGNPYSLYGEQAAAWVGVPSWNYLTLVVAQVTSGSLKQ